MKTVKMYRIGREGPGAGDLLHPGGGKKDGALFAHPAARVILYQ